MKVVLVRPFYESHTVTPPLGLASLAASLGLDGVQVRIVDGLRDGLQPREALRRILDLAPDLVGISCMSSYAHEAIELARSIKAAGAKVAMGGAHPTFLPREIIRQSGADFVIRGEGEQTLRNLVAQDCDPSGLAGVFPLSQLDNDDFDPGMALNCTALDSLPFPDWRDISPASYPLAPHGTFVRAFPVGVTESSRGCVSACSFCAGPSLYGGTIRFFSPERVVTDMERLVRDYGVREIHFTDDNLTFNREHAMSLCTEILRRGLKVHWACPNGIRADRVDRELVTLMRRSGCHMVAFGIESASVDIRRRMGKSLDLDQVERAVNWANECGMTTLGFFIFGLPGETRDTIEETIRFAVGSRLTRAQFQLLDVLPGSPLWHELSGQFVPNWHKRSFKEPEWLPEGLTRADLMQYLRKAFARFYIRPQTLGRVLLSIHPSQLTYLARRIYMIAGMGK